MAIEIKVTCGCGVSANADIEICEYDGIHVVVPAGWRWDGEMCPTCEAESAARREKMVAELRRQLAEAKAKDSAERKAAHAKHCHDTKMAKYRRRGLIV